MASIVRLTLVGLGTAAYLGLAILGWGGFAAFFSHTPLIALAIVVFAMSDVAFLAGGNLSAGVREDRANRWVLVVFTLVGLLDAYLPVTNGIYGVIRHPSYLSLLLNSLGWGLAFRSGVGVLLTALLIAPLLARIDAEEKLLHMQFGDEYNAYRARASRLIPGLY